MFNSELSGPFEKFEPQYCDQPEYLKNMITSKMSFNHSEIRSVKNIILSVIFVVLFFTIGQIAYSQDTTFKAKNVIYVEFLGGSSLLYNIGYERILPIGKKGKLATGLGIQYLPKNEYEDRHFLIPYSLSPQVSYLFNKLKGFELGIGTSIFIDKKDSDPDYYPFARFGYRYHKPEGGLVWKVSFTPTLFYLFDKNDRSVIPWGGASIGWSF